MALRRRTPLSSALCYLCFLLFNPVRRLLTFVLGLALVGAAVYVAVVKLPSAYPLVFRATGVAVVTRSDINKVAAAYCLTGVAGGLGLALAWAWASQGNGERDLLLSLAFSL
jgi:hypothetical protein